VIAAALALVSAATTAAQSTLREGCGTGTVGAVRTCFLAVQAADIVPARATLAATAGNSSAGTASTLGIKLGPMPPLSLGGRVSFARTAMPALDGQADHGDDFTALFLGADARVGLYSGLAPFATVGGLGSIDLLASLGVVKLPGDRFNSPVAWGLGARLGILRESFTAPGISLSAMYHRLGETQFGDAVFSDQNAYIELNDNATWRLRFAIGKRIAPVALTAGFGWDRTTSDALVRTTIGIPPPGGGSGSPQSVETSGEAGGDGRFNAFADVSYTLVVLTLAAEVGWQGGGETPPAVSGVSDFVGKGGLFGGITFRLTL
jgi:hypothetical protein